ncbi:hypothetical protein [Lysinibacillus sphaericus]|uniref:hypothetical protein n=1 Tax=Lysinibacillus sphaericus TaxID=1421 RepID=UPI001CBED809|nr:hypothetical protein [Lysinibacillus sphaericus]
MLQQIQRGYEKYNDAIANTSIGVIEDAKLIFFWLKSVLDLKSRYDMKVHRTKYERRGGLDHAESSVTEWWRGL